MALGHESEPGGHRLHIVQCQWRWQGRGAEQVALDLHRCFGVLGHESSVWAGYVAGPSPPEEVEVLEDREPGLLRRTVATATLRPRLRGVDAVLCHSPAAILHVGLVAVAARVPVRLAVHHFEPGTVGRVARWSERWLGTVGVMHRNVYVSETLASITKEHPRRYRDRIVVIPNGVSVPTVGRSEARRRLGLSEDEPVVATAGALTEHKNHRVLIAAAAAGGEWLLLLAGDGPLRADLESAAHPLGDRVRFLGHIPHEDVGQLLAAADVVAHPATREAHPLAQLEALAADRPVVASDIASSRAACGDAARYVPAHDAAAWARELNRLMDDSAVKAELAAARRVRPVRSPEDVAAAYLDLMDPGVGESRHG